MAQQTGDPGSSRPGAGTAKLSAAEVMLYLSGADYPRSRAELINYAKSKQASGYILSYLERLPEKFYTSPADVELEIVKLT